VGSTGRRNTFAEPLGWCFIIERFSWALGYGQINAALFDHDDGADLVWSRQKKQ